MRQFTTDEIQHKFETLPQEVQDAVTSPEVHDSLISISKKYNLLLDQEAELIDQVGLVMLGFSSSKDFIQQFSHEADVDTATASKIATDINEEIFGKIRTSMREIEEKELATEHEKQSQTDLEQAGDFTLEGPEGSNHIDQTQHALESHADIIAGIENPDMLNTTHTDLLVDHLLSGPRVAVAEKVEQRGVGMGVETPKIVPEMKQKVESATVDTGAQTAQKKGPDLYREVV
jgi:hypothetical protein